MTWHGWLGNRTAVPVTEFLDVLDDVYKPDDNLLQDEKADEDAMRNVIIKVLNAFDSVIITERFLESLVLLAAVLRPKVRETKPERKANKDV